jgi:hypothetical protein
MNRFSLLLIVAVVVLLLVNAVQCQRGYSLRSDVESLNALARLQTDSAKLWRDDAGRSRARADVAVANLDAVKQVYGSELNAVASEVKGLKRSLKNLETYTVTNMVTKGEITAGLRDTTIVNNVPAKTFGYSDDWINMSAIITDSVSLKYQVRDSLSFVYYYERRGLFKKPALVIDAISHNPSSTITGIRNIRIQPPKRQKIGIGLYGGYGMSQFGLSPQVGIGVYYKLLEL